MAAFVTFEDVSKVYHSGEIEIRAVDHISFCLLYTSDAADD